MGHANQRRIISAEEKQFKSGLGVSDRLFGISIELPGMVSPCCAMNTDLYQVSMKAPMPAARVLLKSRCLLERSLVVNRQYLAAKGRHIAVLAACF